MEDLDLHGDILTRASLHPLIAVPTKRSLNIGYCYLVFNTIHYTLYVTLLYQGDDGTKWIRICQNW